MKAKYKRLILIVLAIFCIALGAIFLLKNFEQNLIYFYSPSQIIEINNENPQKAISLFKRKIRVGGLIKAQSLKSLKGDKYAFIITDGENEIEVSFQGLLPPMFREGQGIVAQGKFAGIEGNTIYFNAKNLVTKHDENYMPPEVADTLKQPTYKEHSSIKNSEEVIEPDESVAEEVKDELKAKELVE